MAKQPGDLSSKVFFLTLSILLLTLTSCNTRGGLRASSNDNTFQQMPNNGGSYIDLSPFLLGTSLADMGETSDMLNNLGTFYNEEVLEEELGTDTGEMMPLLDLAFSNIKDPDADLQKSWDAMAKIMGILAMSQDSEVLQGLSNLSKNISDEIKKLRKNSSHDKTREAMAKILNLIVRFLSSILSQISI